LKVGPSRISKKLKINANDETFALAA